MTINRRLAGILVTVPLFLLAPAGTSRAGFFDQFKKDFSKALSGEQVSSQQEAKQPPPKAPEPEPDPTGWVKKASNVRSGPGTGNAKLGLAPKGAEVVILSQQGKWYQVETEIGGNPVTGWIYAPLVELDAVPRQVATPTSTLPRRGSEFPGSDRSVINYAGYSKDFQPVKQMMEKGDLDAVEKFYAQREAEIREELKDDHELMEKIGLLRWLERGTLSIDQGELENSVTGFNKAERILEERQQESKTEGLLKSITQFTAETALGNEELQAYEGEGYERVLMLNYKSIAFLLQGKRKAYNVTRRAIDWQNMEKRAFEKKLREVEEELAEKRRSQKKTTDTGEAAPDVSGRVADDYAALDAKAKQVPSAYVNPFGYYVSGMVQEYESYDDWSLRDNARISYQKALELNPKSKVLKQAAKEMENRTAPAGTRLVHVVVADGFVPEKKMITYSIAAGGQSIPIKLSIYEPVASSVHRVEVQTTGGRRLAVLSPVADIEAICLRHQKDSEPLRQLRVTLAVASSVVTKGLLSNLGVIGSAISQKRDEMAAPDMRSWLSLPKNIQAARLHLKKEISKLKIVSFDKRGRRLASKLVNINKQSHDFVYVRSVNQSMYTHATRDLWMIAGK